jgi:hypothetical protein
VRLWVEGWEEEERRVKRGLQGRDGMVLRI